MADSTSLSFAVGDQTLTFPTLETETFVSPHTGRNLRKLETTLTVLPQAADLTRELLSSPQLTASDGTFWSGNIASESYTNQGPHSLLIQWTECEHINATSVEFEGLVLTPTSYDEQANGESGSITISLRAKLSSTDASVVRPLMASHDPGALYWQVIRRGVSDQPRRMRLGRVLWQQCSDGTIDHAITLVDESFDLADKSPGLRLLAGEPQMSWLINKVSVLSIQLELLLAELASGQHLDQGAVEKIRDSSLKQARDRRYEFFEVDDLSQW